MLENTGKKLVSKLHNRKERRATTRGKKEEKMEPFTMEKIRETVHIDGLGDVAVNVWVAKNADGEVLSRGASKRDVRNTARAMCGLGTRAARNGSRAALALVRIAGQLERITDDRIDLTMLREGTEIALQTLAELGDDVDAVRAAEIARVQRVRESRNGGAK